MLMMSRMSGIWYIDTTQEKEWDPTVYLLSFTWNGANDEIWCEILMGKIGGVPL